MDLRRILRKHFLFVHYSIYYIPVFMNYFSYYDDVRILIKCTGVRSKRKNLQVFVIGRYYH